MTTTELCGSMLYMYDGEYEGECELPEGHDGRHDDGLTTWDTDEAGGVVWPSVD